MPRWRGAAPRRGVPRRWPRAQLACALLVLALGSSTGAAAAAAQQQARPFMTAVLTNVVPRVETRYTWSVSTRADRDAITIPVNSQTGWPQVRYTVSYTRDREAQTVYVLGGNLVISSRDGAATAMQLPQLTVTTASGTRYRMPDEAIQCPSLVVPAGGRVNCSFAAGYAGRQPLPGIVAASVALAGTVLPMSLQAAAAPFDFTRADMVQVGALATTSNYFEQGRGVVQPYGVAGEQPPPGLRLEDSRTFTFTAVFGGLTPSSCSTQQWKAINTAELTPSGDSSAAPATKQSQAVLSVQLSGCGGGAPGPAGFQALLPPPPAAAAVPAPALLQPPAAPDTDMDVPDVPGVEFAEAGSSLCGNGVCPRGTRCFNGFSCCPLATPVCGGQCCSAPSKCIGQLCVPAGGSVCGTAVCKAGETCATGTTPGAVQMCCPAGASPCGSRCCAGVCSPAGQCFPAGSQPCGNTVCTAAQACVQGVCCAQAETVCGGRCCAAGNTCLQNQFCVPLGSTLCGNGQICSPGTTCAGGLLCCPPAATFCAGACCQGTCQANQCLQPGQAACGTTVCSGGQVCLGGVVCCDSSATLCNNACCPNGQTCINNQCVPTGSTACGPTVCPVNQVCGNTQTGLCCQSVQQVGCGNTCCNILTQVCNAFTQTCTDRFNAACAAGQVWCPGAQTCCPVGMLCQFNQCLPRNAVG